MIVRFLPSRFASLVSFAVLASASAWGADAIPPAPAPLSSAQGSSLISTTTTAVCQNTTSLITCQPGSPPPTCMIPIGACKDCPKDPLSVTTGVQISGGGSDNPPPSEIYCSFGSVIDNLSFNHIHIATDYQAETTFASSGCATCGNGAVTGLINQLNRAPGASLIRVHRYRDMLIDSSFGPGVFQTFDEKLYLSVSASGERTVDYFAPGLLNTMRFVDGPWANPWGYSEPLDGVYHNLISNFGVDLRLFDATGALAATQSQATWAVLTYTNGDTRVFQIVTINGAQVGRLTKMTDRGGDAITLSYRYQPTDDLAGSPSLLWEINQVTDAHARTLTFSYGTQQQSGRWAVSRIDLPNGGANLYGYQNGLLSQVTLANGDVASITRAFDNASQKIVVSYDDPAAEDTHRRKQAYLTTTYSVIPDVGTIFPTSAQLVRMVVNGNNEVTYLNVPHPNYTATLLYEGGGDLSYDAYYVPNNTLEHRRQHAQSWSLNPALPMSYGSLVPNYEANYATDTYTSSSYYREWYISTPSLLTDAHGRSVTVTYDALSRITKRQHPDGTTEQFAYNGLGEVTLQVDRLGRATTFTYDAQGHRLSRTVGLHWNAGTQSGETTPDTATTSWAYAPVGTVGLVRCIAETDARGNRTDYVYQANGFVTSIIAPADVAGGTRPVTTIAYTASGLVGSIAEPATTGPRVVQFGYDLRNRPTQTTYADGSTEATMYGVGQDANLVVAKSDRNGNQTVWGYDRSGRRTSEQTLAASTQAVLHQATWTYLDGTDKVATTANDGDTRAFFYDYRLRQVATTVFPTPTVAQTVITIFDAKHRTAYTTDVYGRRTYRGYDGDNRVVRTVRETVAGGVTGVPSDLTTLTAFLAALPRIATVNPPYVINDTQYDAWDQVLVTTDGNGNVRTFVYDTRGRTTQVTDAAGSPVAATTLFGYDAESNQVSVTDPLGTITASTYNGRNLRSSTIEVANVWSATPSTLSATTFYTYSPTKKLLTVMDQRGWVTANTYGVCCDRLVAVTDPKGFVTRFAYDFNGNRTSVTDANNLTTVTAYDGRNRPVAVTNAATEKTTITYREDATTVAGAAGLGLGLGADGSAVITTNALNETTTDIRDGLGRTVRRIDGLGHATTVAYDQQVVDNGTMLIATTSTDALSHATIALQDGTGRTRVVIDALGKRSTTGFDAAGNRLTWRDANNIGQDCVFDARNRDVQCTDTAGAVTRKAYDANNNLVATTDALGKTESSAFDLRNRKTQTTDRVNATTQFTYDLTSNLLTIQDAEGGLTVYGYDERNLLTAEVFPNGQQGRTSRVYAYDAGRRLTGRTVQAINAAGVGVGTAETTSYAYDAANRLTTRGYPDAKNDSFIYDQASRLTQAISGRYTNQVKRAYDHTGRLTGEHLVFTSGDAAGVDLPVSYAYDDTNKVTTLTYPDGSQVKRDYTPRNELFHIWDGAQVVSARSYDDGSRLVQNQAGNGLTETRTYAPNDNLVASISIPSVIGFTYQYDALKRKTVEQDTVSTDQSQRFAYDDQSRLTTWKKGTGVAPADPATVANTWALSPVGDWNQVTTATPATTTIENRAHSKVHELLSINGTALSYDAKGNLTQDDRGQSFAWDYENRLASVANLKQGQGDSAAYSYDALGRRVKKAVTTAAVGPTPASTVPTYFVSAGAQEVVEITGDVTAFNDPTADPEAAGASPFDPATGLGARGSLLADPSATRYNFQPPSTSTPDGWLADVGAASTGTAVGWSSAVTGTDRDHLGRPLYDSFIPLGTSTWQVPVANGTHAVVIMCGDADSRQQTNNLLVNGVSIVDPTPYDGSPTNGYETGSFDGYAVTVNVTNGLLTIGADVGALNPKIDFIEIGTVGSTIDAATTARVTAAAAQATKDTAKPKAKTPPLVKRNIWGDYVDQLATYSVAQPRHVAKRYYAHSGHLYSIAAVTSVSGQVVERYSYTGYGAQTIKNSAAVVLAKSAVNSDRGFTGYRIDAEHGNYYARARSYAPSIGRFISRDPIGLLYGVLRNNESFERDVDKEVEGFSAWLDEIQRKSKSSKNVASQIKEKISSMAKLVVKNRISSISPMALDGYQDGTSLYSAYFVPGKLDPTGTVVYCTGISGFVAVALAVSGSASYCWDDCCPKGSGFVVCIGPGAGLGISAGAGGSVGTGCFSSGGSGQLNLQGVAGVFGGSVTGTMGGTVGAGGSGGPGFGATGTIEGCYAI